MGEDTFSLALYGRITELHLLESSLGNFKGWPGRGPGHPALGVPVEAGVGPDRPRGPANLTWPVIPLHSQHLSQESARDVLQDLALGAAFNPPALRMEARTIPVTSSTHHQHRADGFTQS